MRIPFLLPLMLMAAATLTHAQSSKTAPTWAAQFPGEVAINRVPFQSGRSQQIVDTTGLVQNSAVILGLAYRKAAPKSAVQMTGVTIPGLQIYLGHSPSTVSSPSTNFATNRSGPQTLVFSGSYHLPSLPPSLPTTSFAIGFKFTRAFAYSKSRGNLLIEVVIPNVPGNPTYSVDGAATGGTGYEFGVHGPYPGATGHYFGASGGAPSPGGWFSMVGFVFTTSSPPAFAVAYVGASTQRFGAIPLPFDLTGLGAPGNVLYSSLDLPFPMNVTKNSPAPGFMAMTDLFPIPKHSALLGAHLYAQAIYGLPAANALGLVFSNGFAMRLMTHKPEFSSVVASPSSNAQSGIVGWAPWGGVGGPVVELTGVFN